MRLLPPFPPLNRKPAPLSGPETAHGIRITLIEGVVSVIFMVLIGGTFFNAFAIQLGANAGQLGFITSLAPLSTLIQLAYPWLQRISRSRRSLLLILIIPDRFLLWGVIFIPLLLPRPWWIPCLLGTILIRSLAAQLNNLIYQDWLADLIPVEGRNQYWGLRHTLGGPVGIAAPFLAGFILDRWPGFPGFQILYWIALPLLIWDDLLFLYKDEPPRQSRGPGGGRQLWHCLRTQPFRNYLGFFFGWTMLQGALTPYTSYIMFKVYHLPFLIVSGLTVLATVTSTILYIAWGKTQDRYGPFLVYRYILPGIAVTSGLWAFTTARDYGLYLLIFTASGALNAATLVGGFCLLLMVVPEADRSRYLTINYVSLGIAGFLGPNLGAALLRWLEQLPSRVLGWHLSPLQRLFLIGSIGSLLLALIFPKLVKPFIAKS